jgi:dCMP deaminase
MDSEGECDSHDRFEKLILSRNFLTAATCYPDIYEKRKDWVERIKAGNKWDKRFLKLAKEVSDWSKDPSTKVGAVITKNKRLVCAGFNGFPEGDEDKLEDYTNREVKLSKIIHAENNAIMFATEPLKGCTMYTWPLMPCAHCASMIIQKKFSKVVSVVNDNPRWQESFKITRQSLEKSGIELVLYNTEELGL